MNAHLHLIKVYNDKLNQAWRDRTNDDDPERGNAIETAIIVVALIGLAVALVALLTGAFTNRSAGLN